MTAKQPAFFYRLVVILLTGLSILVACQTNSSRSFVPPVDTPAPPTTAPPQEISTPTQPMVATAAAQDQTSPTPTPSSALAISPAEIPADSVTSFPDPQKYQWKEIVQGLVKPVELADPADGTGRLFIVEQGGTIRILKDGRLLSRPYLDVSRQISTTGNEQGLLGLALDPKYAQNGFFFINYTDSRGDTVISRWRVSADPDQADPGSEHIILQQDQPFSNHNGGMLAFGPDGFLYIALGDGGKFGDPYDNAQSPDSLLGKLLRIDVNQPERYSIPADNPYALKGGRPEVWALGLRNPWKFSFDRLTGDLYIADVGQDKYEEIDFLPAGSPGGANFGWNYREASHPYKGQPPAGLNLIDPVYEYNHSQGCSVTGGYVYRGQNLAEWRGIYLFGDYCRGTVWGALRNPQGNWEVRNLFQTDSWISSFGEDQNGEIYLLDHRQGRLLRLEQQP